jgi:hypothetical protein
MADKFFAVTAIKYGKRTEDGSQDGKYESKTFKAGDEVSGLSKEDMTSLWNAGALQRRDGEDDKAEEDKKAPVTPASTPAPSPSKADAKK